MAGRSYRIGEVLGAGGFGTVYRAELVGEAGFRKAVAVKVLHPNRGSPDRVARLRDEARILGRLRHRSLVAVDALVRLDGRFAVVMELVPGRSLDGVLRDVGVLPPTVALEVVAEVAAGLEAAHAATEDGRAMNLVHRDVKPANVHLTPQGEVKLLDFGIARADLAAREAETRDRVYGSPPYMAPERLEGEDSAAGDVFALGITLVELLTGERPDGVVARPDPHAARLGWLRSRVAGLELDPALPELVERMLAYDPATRPTATEVGSAVRAIRAGLSGPTAADWAAERGWPDQGGVAGELSGRELVESGEAEGPASTGPLLDGAEATFTVSLSGASAVVVAPTRPPAVSPPRRRSWAPWVISFGGMLAILLVMGFGTLTGAAVGGLWVAGVGRASCSSTADEMRTLLRASSGDTAPGLTVAERVDRMCARGDLGLLSATFVLTEVERTTKDGAFTAADAEDLAVVAAMYLE